MKYFLDLFAGIGGFALGAEWAGLKFDKHFFSEVDSYAISVYRNRFPDAISLGSICDIKGSDLPAGEWTIAGGFPCQDISVAGKGAGLDGGRSGLWFEYARIIGELRPRFAIMENVGALTIRGLDRVLGSLAEIGYDAEWQDIRASDVGAPHRRERIWIVAYPASIRMERCKTEFGKQRKRKTLRRAFGVCEAQKEMADASDKRNVRRNGELESTKREVQGHNGSAANGGRKWWSVEPDVGRVAHGIPSRVDRLKCLGNSIVPEIAVLIFSGLNKY